MPATSNRGYDTPAHGGAVDSWDSDLNAVFNQIDQNLGAVSTVPLTNVNVVLNAAQYVCGTIRLSGTLTGNVVVTFPSVSAWWAIDNQCTGNFYVQLTCGAGNRVCAPPGEAVDILTDGSGVSYRNLGRVGSYLDLGASSVPSWITNCTVPPYLHADGSGFSGATYPILAAMLGGTTLPDARGRVRYQLNEGTGRLTTAGGLNGDAFLANGGNSSGLTIGQTNLPNVSFGLTIADTRTWRTTNLVYSSGGVFGLPGGGLLAALPIQQPVELTGAGVIGGSAASGGNGTKLASVPDGYVGGITLIRAG